MFAVIAKKIAAQHQHPFMVGIPDAGDIDTIPPLFTIPNGLECDVDSLLLSYWSNRLRLRGSCTSSHADDHDQCYEMIGFHMASIAFDALI